MQDKDRCEKCAKLLEIMLIINIYANNNKHNQASSCAVQT